MVLCAGLRVDRVEFEYSSECYEHVQDKLISAYEINDQYADSVALVNGDKSGCKLVHDDDEEQVHGHLREENGSRKLP